MAKRQQKKPLNSLKTRLLRYPVELDEKIKIAADKNRRAVIAEIEITLQEKYSA